MLGDLQQPDTKIISAASVPAKRSGPNPVLITMATSFAGALFGAIIVFILEQLETTIRKPEELFQLVGMETLAVIPEITAIPATELADHMFSHPYSILTEAIRNLCIRLIGRIEKKSCVITLSPCIPTESATRLGLCMAKLMAKGGLKIVLIDGDLRYPNFENYLDIKSQTPLTELFLSQSDPQLIQDQVIPNLSFLTGINSPSDEITNLSLSHILTYLNKIKNSADIILIDTAPFSIAETRLFNKAADYVLAVVPWNQVPFKMISNLIRKIYTDKDKFTGFIITDSPEDKESLYS